MPLPKERFYTVDDYWALPEGQRAELINGQFYDLAAPSQVHQGLVVQFSRIFGIISQSITEAVKFFLLRLPLI